ncbi:hypothetical protein MASR1M45_09270 [Candidatus Kapaibacterium sp.]
MFTIYLACLIFGGILLSASLFSFGDSHSDIDNTDTGHLDHNNLPDTDTHIDKSFHQSSLTKELSKLGVAHEAAQFFSFRNFTYFTAFFGLTGTMLSLIGFGTISTFLSSLGLGSFSFVFGYFLMKYLKDNESGKEVEYKDLIGKTGKVSLDISKAKHGKVILNAGNQVREYSALLNEFSENETLKKNDSIIVLDIMNDHLIIDKSEL